MKNDASVALASSRPSVPLPSRRRVRGHEIPNLSADNVRTLSLRRSNSRHSANPASPNRETETFTRQLSLAGWKAALLCSSLHTFRATSSSPAKKLAGGR
jgi:hypothetical protein